MRYTLANSRNLIAANSIAISTSILPTENWFSQPCEIGSGIGSEDVFHSPAAPYPKDFPIVSMRMPAILSGGAILVLFYTLLIQLGVRLPPRSWAA